MRASLAASQRRTLLQPVRRASASTAVARRASPSLLTSCVGSRLSAPARLPVLGLTPLPTLIATHRSVASSTLRPTMTSSLVTEIKVDHDNIRDLLERFRNAHSMKDVKMMQDIVNTMVREASLHSDAEEMSVYKGMDHLEMHDVAEHDRIEHNEVKQAMSTVDNVSPDSAGLDKYATMVEEAATKFLRHAEDEERDQLPRLVGRLNDEEQRKMTDDFLNARKMATSRPHPMASQGGGVAQKVGEVLSKPMDEAVHKMRDHVALKYEHREPGRW